MAVSSWLWSGSLPWIAAVGSFLVFAYSSELGSLTVFLTTSALILCPVIISHSMSCRCKSVLTEESRPEPEKDASCPNQESVMTEREVTAEQEARVSDQKKEEKAAGDYALSASETLSDFSENIEFDHSSSSEDSENDWIFRSESLNQNTVLSDGSISDEESLIEIALPESQSWYGFQQKWSDCSLESHFRHQNWMDMMNEEENLIEIDIFMGSIKSTRFEIEA